MSCRYIVKLVKLDREIVSYTSIKLEGEKGEMCCGPTEFQLQLCGSGKAF